MKGFKFAGIHAGIKNNNLKDLGLIYCDTPAVAAALFTRNQVVAAPVILGREKIKSGRCQAVLVNSGNANCFTGDQGMKDAVECSRLTAEVLDIPEELVIVSSTGVIGAPLPMEKFKIGIPMALKELDVSNLKAFADAILTTDTFTKVVSKTVELNGDKFTITGVAKGSGMIRPDMATMLAFVMTDINISAPELNRMLLQANKGSFNRISVDGDTSTNDTLLALSSCASILDASNASVSDVFQQTLDHVCLELARMVVKDGEGATKLIEICVKGAMTSDDAFKACDAIAHSNLVKTAIYGEDPNWGRITAAAGRSGAHVVQDKMDLFFDDSPLVKGGVWLGKKAENKAAQIMKNNEIHITLDLNLGEASDRFLFCDFSENYVKINAEYRS